MEAYYQRLKKIFDEQNIKEGLTEKESFLHKYWIKKRPVPLGQCGSSVLVNFLYHYEFSVNGHLGFHFSLNITRQEGFYVIANLYEFLAIVDDNDILRGVYATDLVVADPNEKMFSITLLEYDDLYMLTQPAHKILDIFIAIFEDENKPKEKLRAEVKDLAIGDIPYYFEDFF